MEINEFLKICRDAEICFEKNGKTYFLKIENGKAQIAVEVI